MSGNGMESSGPDGGGSWRPFAVGLCVLSLLAIVIAPAALEAPAAARATALGEVPVAPVAPVAPGPAAAPTTVDPPSSPITLPPPTVAAPPAFGSASDGQGPAGPVAPPGTTPVPPMEPGDPSPPAPPAGSGGEGDEDGEGEPSPLTTLAQAIPVPPDLPVPEVPGEVTPLTDSIAPAMFLVCSFASLPGGLAGVVVGLGGGSIPGLADFVGALLLYQAPILDLCLILGFPDEVVACTVDDEIRSQVPTAVPVRPPAPAGSMLGIARGVEGTLTGDTAGSDQALGAVGCEARLS